MEIEDRGKSFVIKFDGKDLDDKNAMSQLNEMMNDVQEGYNQQIKTIEKELNISDEYAGAIWYLRTRSRWTQELEDKLVLMARTGESCPNMNEWPE